MAIDTPAHPSVATSLAGSLLIAMPTLRIAGELDRSSSPLGAKMIADAIPGARFTVIPGAPHMLFLELPEAVAQEVEDFLQGSPTRQGSP